MNKKFCVYEHIFPNNKRYIGITSKTPNARWENGSGYSKKTQSAMYYAIKKYGWENVKHNILAEDLSFEDACLMEKDLIAKYKTNISRYGDSFGYNLTDGGDGTLGHKCSEASKKRMSEARKGKINGSNCHRSKAVICDGIEYESITDFRKKNNLNRNVESWLCGFRPMPKEWYDKGLRYKDDSLNGNVRILTRESCCQVYYNGNIYESQAELARELGVSTSIICYWLSGKKKMPDKIKEKGLYRIK